MDHKVSVRVVVNLSIRVSEGQSLDEVIEEMEYDFKASNDVDADIEDTEIVSYELIDSK